MIPNLCTLNSNWMPRTLFPCHIPAQFFLDLGNPAKLSREAYPKCCLHCSHQLQLFAVSSLARSLCVSMLAEYWLSLHFQEGRKRVGGEEGREGGESGVSPFDSWEDWDGQVFKSSNTMGHFFHLLTVEVGATEGLHKQYPGLPFEPLQFSAWQCSLEVRAGLWSYCGVGARCSITLHHFSPYAMTSHVSFHGCGPHWGDRWGHLPLGPCSETVSLGSDLRAQA